MGLKRILNFFNPRAEDASWKNWLELHRAYFDDKEYCLMLDVGCGTGYGSALKQFRQSKTIGCDIEAQFSSLQYLEKWVGSSAEALAFKSNVFDFISCNWVLEHLQNPSEAINEIFRVLKPGGLFIFRTPNIWNYAILMSKFTSTHIHHLIRRLNAERDHEHVDNVPTYYYANRKKILMRHVNDAGFHVVQFSFEGSASEYLRFFLPFYILGQMGDLITNVFPLRGLKKNIVCIVKKP